MRRESVGIAMLLGSIAMGAIAWAAGSSPAVVAFVGWEIATGALGLAGASVIMSTFVVAGPAGPR